MTKNPDSAIRDYNFEGLYGRYGHWMAHDASSKRTIVLLYGQHATIERVMAIVEALREFGDVYIVDNPGFGGMDASYKNGKYPSLSFFASHFKHFIDTHVAKDRRLTLFGISFGFQIVTQMLHDYPAECKRVETVVSFAGFVHPSDFSMSLSYKLPLIEGVARTSRTRIGGSVYKALRHERLIVAVYMLTKPIQVKIKTMDRKTARSYAKEQAALWKTNDARTQGATAWDFVKKNDLTDYRIEADLVYLGVPNDHILDSSRVKSELEHMYGNMSAYDLLLDNHAPLDIETSAKVRAVLPKPFIESMKKSSNKVAVI